MDHSPSPYRTKLACAPRKSTGAMTTASPGGGSQWFSAEFGGFQKWRYLRDSPFSLDGLWMFMANPNPKKWIVLENLMDING